MQSTLGRTGLPVSRLSFGTAEIGFAYGIGSRPLPTEDEAVTLLKYAVERGVTFFDTASYYGLSEERIGASGILNNEHVLVETKCAQFLEKGEYFTPAELEQKIRVQVTESLAKLRVDTLPILMLHGPSAEQIAAGELIDILKTLQREGLVRFTGVSTRGEESPLAALASGAFDVIQVAYSILDQRMSANVLTTAARANVAIVNRSVLLKGALTPLRSHLPSGLEPVQQRVQQAEHIAVAIGTDLPTLAIRFALSNPHITTTLIGTNKKEHLDRAIAAVEAGPLSEEILTTLRTLALTDIHYVDPAHWPKLS